MGTAQTITPPAIRATPVADQMFDAVFNRSSEFRIKMDFDTAISFLRRIASWNEFESDRVTVALTHVDSLIPKTFYGPGSPNNGVRAYTIRVGRESSPVVYLERYEFRNMGLSLSDFAAKRICELMQTDAQADEAYYRVEELPANGGRKITFRFWWD